MKRTIIAALAALTLTGLSARAEAPPSVVRLPYTKADAYAKALNEWCFVDEPFPLTAKAAFLQGWLVDGVDLDHWLAESDKAGSHLKGDQGACGPALAFVRGVEDRAGADIGNLEHLIALDEMAQGRRQIAAEITRREAARIEREKEVAARIKAKAEQEAAAARQKAWQESEAGRRKAEKERLTAELRGIYRTEWPAATDAEYCAATMDDEKAEPAFRARVLRLCVDVLEPEAITNWMAAHPGKSLTPTNLIWLAQQDEAEIRRGVAECRRLAKNATADQRPALEACRDNVLNRTLDAAVYRRVQDALEKLQ